MLRVLVMLSLTTLSSCFSSPAVDCEPLVQAVDGVATDAAAGVDRCNGGRVYNSTAVVTCTLDAVRLCSASANGVGSCSVDDDCAAGERCIDNDGPCGCAVVCSSDDDCGAGEACLCASIDGDGIGGVTQVPKCLPATCRTADDCGGADCGVQEDFCGHAEGLACRHPGQCVVDDDCPFGMRCVGDGDGWSCVPNDIICE